MRLVTVSGPPASGKTAVILKALGALPGYRAGVVKFDCLSTFDDEKYRRAGYGAAVGVSGSLCPDHYYVNHIQDCLDWGLRQGLDLLVCESAGLCNRCSPHIEDVLAVCVVDALSGVEAPRKIGPMLKLADVVAVTKGDVVSQAEREVFAMRVAEANPTARILLVNGLTGQGTYALAQLFLTAGEPKSLLHAQLRFAMPGAICNFCYGNRDIVKGYRTGVMREMVYLPPLEAAPSSESSARTAWARTGASLPAQPGTSTPAQPGTSTPALDRSQPFSAQPLSTLVQIFPQVREMVRSFNLPRVDWSRSLEQNLAGLTFTDFQDSGLSQADLTAQFQAAVAWLAELTQRPAPKISSLTVLGGRDKDGGQEELELTLHPGEIITLVGPTGSGKSRFLEDVEFLADGDTPTGRRIRIDGRPVDPDQRYRAENRLVAQISQNMRFVMDLSVGAFLSLHGACRSQSPDRTEQVIQAANQLCGEPFGPETALTQLSGGQSRALMIADVALLSAAPVVLIDEIENAGVDRRGALSLLAGADKIVLVSTHDPVFALLGDRRLVIANGAVAQVRTASEKERENLAILARYDRQVTALREQIRQGGAVDQPDLAAWLLGPDPVEP